MGQKVHPYGFRLGFNKTWKSKWFADRKYADLVHEETEQAVTARALVDFALDLVGGASGLAARRLMSWTLNTARAGPPTQFLSFAS